MFCLYTKTQNQKTDFRKQKTEDKSYKKNCDPARFDAKEESFFGLVFYLLPYQAR
jgi:hypothetical protein